MKCAKAICSNPLEEDHPKHDKWRKFGPNLHTVFPFILRVKDCVNPPPRPEAARTRKHATLFILTGDSILTYPDDRVELRHGDLLGALDGRGDLLLVLLRQEGQHLPHDGRQPLDDLGLKWTT